MGNSCECEWVYVSMCVSVSVCAFECVYVSVSVCVSVCLCVCWGEVIKEGQKPCQVARGLGGADPRRVPWRMWDEKGLPSRSTCPKVQVPTGLPGSPLPSEAPTAHSTAPPSSAWQHHVPLCLCWSSAGGSGPGVPQGASGKLVPTSQR